MNEAIEQMRKALLILERESGNKKEIKESLDKLIKAYHDFLSSISEN
ncbi:MAG: hypothetical protein H6625_14115 [Bdellovibrionaceae bacterium]|nr:hypothetical protein [Pseudobdellovibrionaceae bacterium]